MGVAREDDFELIEDAVVFVGVAEAWAEMFVDGDGFYGLTLHVDIPDFDSKVVTGEDVSTVMGEANIGDGGDDFGEE